MVGKYPGLRARKACAERTRAELLEYQPKRPLAFRDELRIRGMHGRCAACRACPGMVMTLTAMMPPEAEPASAEIFRLAG